MNNKSRKPKAQSQQYSVPALDKGLDILECLAARREALTQMDIARALGKGQSEIYRMLACLERRGYVRKDPTALTYSLSLRLFELAHAHSPYEVLLHAAQRPMRALAASTGESCHLSVLYGENLLVLAQEESGEAVRVSVEVGSVSSPLHTVSGRLLLAYAPAEQRDAVLAAQPAPPRKAVLKQLLARLETIRQNGLETQASESVEGLHDIAVLIGHESGSVQAALAIAALRRRNQPVNEPHLLEALRRCAAEITGSAGLASLV